MPNSGRIGLYHLAAKKEEDDIWIREGGKKNDLSDRLKKSHFKAASRRRASARFIPRCAGPEKTDAA